MFWDCSLILDKVSDEWNTLTATDATGGTILKLVSIFSAFVVTRTPSEKFIFF